MRCRLVPSPQEFANFLEECGFEYPFPEVHELYMQLAQPANLLTVTMFYRNLEGHASLTQLGKRLEDVRLTHRSRKMPARSRFLEGVHVREDEWWYL